MLTTALWIDAYQAIHGENKNKSFFGSFSVNEMRMKRDSWIGVSRQIRKGDDVPLKPDGRTEFVRQSNFEKRGVAVEPIGPMTLNKEKHLSKYHNIYGKNS